MAGQAAEREFEEVTLNHCQYHGPTGGVSLLSSSRQPLVRTTYVDPS